MNWSQFAAAAPELTVLAEERFQKSGLIPLGTITVDGSSRVSPSRRNRTWTGSGYSDQWRSGPRPNHLKFLTGHVAAVAPSHYNGTGSG